MREDLIMAEVSRFFAERVFGPNRRELFMAALDTADDAVSRDREEQRQRLRRKLADITRKQGNVLGQAESADPTDPFVQGLRQRYNALETERLALVATLDGLDEVERGQPDRPHASQADLLDALPHLALNLHRAPAELLDRLFDLTQLTVQVHYATDEATLKVVLPADNVTAIGRLGAATSDMSRQAGDECCEAPGQHLCASGECPR